MPALKTTCAAKCFLCGIFSQVDLLRRKPGRRPAPPAPARPGGIRHPGATGPYAPWLEAASALESGNTKVIRDVCRAHGLEADEVNRALLRLAGCTGLNFKPFRALAPVNTAQEAIKYVATQALLQTHKIQTLHPAGQPEQQRRRGGR